MSDCPSKVTNPVEGSKHKRRSVLRFVKQLKIDLGRKVHLERCNLRGGTSISNDERNVVITPEARKNKARLPIEELADKRPALLEAPITYLHVYLSNGQYRDRSLERSPTLHFALTQCSLTYRYICTRIQKRTLKAGVLRESMINIITLIHTLGRTYPDVSEPVSEQMQKFISVLEDLDRQLAERSNLPSLNWQSIVSALKMAVQEHKMYMDPRPFSDFVPSMDDFAQSKLLGRGAFGAVYKAVFKGDLDVAVKVVPQQKVRADPRDETLLIDKMVGAVITNHPFLCRIYCAFIASVRDHSGPVVDSAPCSVSPSLSMSVTVMEAIDGVDLTELIGRNSALNFNLAQILIQQCMMATEHMHLSGFVHRDIKPANMIVMRDGRLKLIDFDVSRVCICHMGNQFQMSYFSRTAMEFIGGDKAGTEAYMAPEVHLGKTFGRASDWWSVGVVHFRLALGRLPFRNQQIADQIINQEIDWERFGDWFDPQLTALKSYLSRLLVKDPRSRLGSREYSDIFEHPLFADVNWQKLPEQVACSDELDAVFAERGSTEYERERASLGPAGGGGHLSRDDVPSLKNLVDIHRDHVPLLTFTSKLIKKLVTGDPGPEGSEDPLRWRHVSDLRKSGDETTGGTTNVDKKLKKGSVQVIVQDLTRVNPCRAQRRAVTLRRLLSEDGMHRYMVNEIATGAKMLGEAKLYHGDLVLEIDKTPLTNLPEHRVDQLLAKKGAPLIVSVAQGNPFREAGEATFNITQLLFRFKPMHLSLRGTPKIRKCSCCRPPQMLHGFTLSLRKVYMSGAAELVCFIDSHEVSLQRVVAVGDKDDKDTLNVYTGDVVLAINNCRLEQLIRGTDPEKQVRRLTANMFLDLDIVPCSPFRVSNMPSVDAT